MNFLNGTVMGGANEMNNDPFDLSVEGNKISSKLNMNPMKEKLKPMKKKPMRMKKYKMPKAPSFDNFQKLNMLKQKMMMIDQKKSMDIMKGQIKLKEKFKTIDNYNRIYNKGIPSQYLPQPETIARRRLRQQQGLNMFGDYDGDGLANVLDCNPRNYFQQGNQHSPEQFLTVRENTQPGMVNPQGEIESSNEMPRQERVIDAEVIDVPERSRIQDIKQKIMVGGSKAAEGLKNIYAASGVSQKLSDIKARKEQEQKIRQQAREEALKKVEQLDAEKIYKEELKKTLGIKEKPVMRAKTKREELRGVLRDVRRDISTGTSAGAPGYTPDPLAGESQRVANLIGLGGEQGVARSLLPTSSDPYVVKVDDLVGKGTLRQQIQSRPAPTIAPAMERLTPTVPAPTPVAKAGELVVEGVVYKQLPGGKWKNTKTGNVVSYPRGTYTKRYINQ